MKDNFLSKMIQYSFDERGVETIYFSKDPIIYPNYTKKEKQKFIEMLNKKMSTFSWHKDAWKDVILNPENHKDRECKTTILSMPFKMVINELNHINTTQKARKDNFKWLVENECKLVLKWRLKIGK